MAERARVAARTPVTAHIVAVDLVPAAGATTFPAADAGAHVDLELEHPEGRLVRSYSLVEASPERYRIAVARDRQSRGGSIFVHDELAIGTELTLIGPRNNFALREDASATVLVAGGIGITPIYAMARRLSAIGKPWSLHYFVRTAALAAFADELRALPGGEMHLSCDDERGGALPDLAPIVAGAPADADLYCCGPLPMLAAFTSLTTGPARAPERIHVEYFTPPREADTSGGLVVRLARDGRVIIVPAGKTILDAILDEGLDVPCSCLEGHCGTCETRVLAGLPDHRDVFLTAEQKARNDRMMICVSGALTAELTLDI